MNTTTTRSFSFVEQMITRKGSVLALRPWPCERFYEVDLHLPQADMHKWQQAMKINCRVGRFTFREYTPCCWDNETHTCTLLIDAGHDGAGSRWVRSLQAGDTLYYTHIESARQAPVPESSLVFLGDTSAIGHFSALQQLAGQQAISGALLINEASQQSFFKENFPGIPLDTVSATYSYPEQLFAWIEARPRNPQQVFYLAGNNQLVLRLRRFLKEQGYAAAQVKSQGFWK